MVRPTLRFVLFGFGGFGREVKPVEIGHAVSLGPKACFTGSRERGVLHLEEPFSVDGHDEPGPVKGYGQAAPSALRDLINNSIGARRRVFRFEGGAHTALNFK